MPGDVRRMDYIREYLSAYEAKLHLSNRLGLLDNAKLFELFAIRVCGIWFGQKFHNLNKETVNYPYVDLISEDEMIYVQVSTALDTSKKVRATLKNLRACTDPPFCDIQRVVFFMLGDQNEVKDELGESTGRISFSAADDIVTVKAIAQRAMEDMDFQHALYDVLYDEFTSIETISKSLSDVVAVSRDVGLAGIECKINGEYEIDRSALVDKILQDGAKNVVVLGPAGCGKSALCRLLAEKEKLVLYARAELLAEVTHLNQVWDLDLKKALAYLGERRILIFVDALEFISDCSPMKTRILEELYTVANQFPYVSILVSCRSGDWSSFLTLESRFAIVPYGVGEITEEELSPLMERYPVLKQMHQSRCYSDLLRSPFYIDHIVRHQVDLDNIRDENEFRHYLWESVICLGSRAKSYGLTTETIEGTVERLTLERAQKFLLGVHRREVSPDILHALLSENILRQQGDYVRLKYDIFEDICFEQYFDRAFEACRGQYQMFYQEVDSLGRCAYRRYQIWISNKLFVQENRDKFVYVLLFSDCIPPQWKRETEIGIVKSHYCDEMFAQYELELWQSGKWRGLLNTINLFAFEAQLRQNEDSRPQLLLRPTGKGCSCLIRLLRHEDRFHEAEYTEVMQLCGNYATGEKKNDETSLAACEMAEFFYGLLWENCCQSGSLYDVVEKLAVCLKVLYSLAEKSLDWIRDLWRKWVAEYLKKDRSKFREAEKLIEWTLQNPSASLIDNLGREMCALAEVYWVQKPIENQVWTNDLLHREKLYGLSQNADDYHFRSPKSNLFLWALFRRDLIRGLTWTVDFVNKAVESFSRESPSEVVSVTLWFAGTNTSRTYLGSAHLWLAGIEETSAPLLLGDMIYLLRCAVLEQLEASYKKSPEDFREVAKILREYLFTHSNNIALLTIVEAIGMHFVQALPGYALDLATGMELLHWDAFRYIKYAKNPLHTQLEQQIYASVGMPFLELRYPLDPICSIPLQSYVAQSYFQRGAAREKYEAILDYMYKKTPDDREHTSDHLQIQKMDLRGATEISLGDGAVAFKPKLTGEAEKLVRENEQSELPVRHMESSVARYAKTVSMGSPDLDAAIKAIDEILNQMEKNPLRFQYQQALITVVASALTNPALSMEKREELCLLWLGEIGQIFSHDTYLGEISLTIALLKQLDTGVTGRAREGILLLILSCLLYDESDGNVRKLAQHIKNYLIQTPAVARMIFNTSVAIAKLYVSRKGMPEAPKEEGTDDEEYIRKYLFEGEPLTIESFHPEQYDVEMLCRSMGCGLSLDDPVFSIVVANVLPFAATERCPDGKRMDVYAQYEMVEFLQRELIHSPSEDAALSLLFEERNFSPYSKEIVDFYLEVLECFLCEFIDSHSDPVKRSQCKQRLLALEKKILEIKDARFQKALYPALTFSAMRHVGGDWSKIKVGYSYADKQFLNQQFSRYGKYHLKKLLRTIRQMHMDALLPEILPSLRDSLRDAIAEKYPYQDALDGLRDVTLWAFLTCSDSIKGDQQLTEAYEELLQLLVGLNDPQSAVLLDEFRLH